MMKFLILILIFSAMGCKTTQPWQAEIAVMRADATNAYYSGQFSEAEFGEELARIERMHQMMFKEKKKGRIFQSSRPASPQNELPSFALSTGMR